MIWSAHGHSPKDVSRGLLRSAGRSEGAVRSQRAYRPSATDVFRRRSSTTARSDGTLVLRGFRGARRDFFSGLNRIPTDGSTLRQLRTSYDQPDA